MASFEEQQLDHLSQLARIKLDEQSREYCLKNLSRMIAYLDLLKSAPLPDSQDAQPAVFEREDNIVASLTADEALGQAPVRQGDAFVLPRVVD